MSRREGSGLFNPSIRWGRSLRRSKTWSRIVLAPISERKTDVESLQMNTNDESYNQAGVNNSCCLLQRSE